MVPSAPGKRFSDDTKVTDMLYACYDLADQGKSFKAELDAIKAIIRRINRLAGSWILSIHK